MSVSKSETTKKGVVHTHPNAPTSRVKSRSGLKSLKRV
jgi:hypothetical protein